MLFLYHITDVEIKVEDDSCSDSESKLELKLENVCQPSLPLPETRNDSTPQEVTPNGPSGVSSSPEDSIYGSLDVELAVSAANEGDRYVNYSSSYLTCTTTHTIPIYANTTATHTITTPVYTYTSPLHTHKIPPIHTSIAHIQTTPLYTQTTPAYTHTQPAVTYHHLSTPIKQTFNAPIQQTLSVPMTAPVISHTSTPTTQHEVKATSLNVLPTTQQTTTCMSQSVLNSSLASAGPLPPIKMFYSDTFSSDFVQTNLLGLMQTDLESDLGVTPLSIADHSVIYDPGIDTSAKANVNEQNLMSATVSVISSVEPCSLSKPTVTPETTSNVSTETDISDWTPDDDDDAPGLTIIVEEEVESHGNVNCESAAIVHTILEDLLKKVISEVKDSNTTNQKKRKSKVCKQNSTVVDGDSPKHKDSKGAMEKNKRKNPNPRKVDKSSVSEILDTAVDSGDETADKNNRDNKIRSKHENGISGKPSEVEKIDSYELRHNRPLNVARTLCGTRRPQKNGIRHVCKLCSQEFTHGRPFKTHLQGHTTCEMSCRQCKDAFVNKALFLHHSCSKPLPLSHLCPRCNYVCTSTRQLNIHMRSAHKISVTSLAAKTCTECGEVFSLRSQLYEHMQVSGWNITNW